MESRWRCGKCEGMNVPEHHWSCQMRIRPAPIASPIHVNAAKPEKQAPLIALIKGALARPDDDDAA